MQAGTPEIISFWLKMQWVGISCCGRHTCNFPTRVGTTGKTSRGRRRLMIVSVFHFAGLPDDLAL